MNRSDIAEKYDLRDRVSARATLNASLIARVGVLMNGLMKFQMFGRTVTYYGAPFPDKGINMASVKMAKEIKAPCTWDVPTQDFRTPPYDPMKEALEDSMAFALMTGQAVFVGCMAGRGRTGLFMATLSFLTGSESPVADTREQYYPHAVETQDQARYVKQSFSRGMFRESVMRKIISGGAMTFGWFMKMPFADKLLYLKMRYAG